MRQASLTRAYDATQLSRAFRGKGAGRITAKVEPASDLIVDGQRLSDIERLMIVLAPENWTSTSDKTVSVSPPTVVRITAGVEVPASLDEEQEQTDELRVEFTVSDKKGAMRHVRIDYTVYPVATVATPGELGLDVSRDSGSLTIPFTDLFAPASQSDNWAVPSDIALADAPAGVTLGAGSLRIETRDLVAQMNTQFTVTASDVVYPDTVRAASKTINLSVLSNAIEILSAPAFVQGYEGGSALEDSNHAALSDPANYTGLTDPAFDLRLSVDGKAADIETHQWVEGEQAQLVVDVWNHGRRPADGESDARFQSEVMVVERLLELSDTSGPSLTITVNPAAPDSYPVDGVVVNGRDLNDGLTVGDFRPDQMALVQDGILAAPGGTALGEDLIFTPPTVIAPEGSTVLVTYDLIDAADDSVILADQTFTTDTLATTIDAGLQGVTAYWRAKFRATGLTDLDADSANLTLNSLAADRTFTEVV